MANWKKLLVGDAFQLSSKDPNYYRDLALLWPVLAFSIATAAALTDDSLSRSYLYKSLVGLIVCLLLAKEKWLLVGGAGAFVALRTMVALPFNWDRAVLPELLMWFLVSSSVVAAILCYLVYFRKRGLSYRMPRGFHIMDLVVGMASLGITIALFVFWVRE